MPLITSLSGLDLESTIHGVVFKVLKTHNDGRGFFREIIRSTDQFFDGEFGQWSHSKMQKNTVKAWHYHHLQIDWWYLAVGLIHTVLSDHREESPTFGVKMEFLLGDPELDERALEAAVRIPTGVLHGCKVLSPAAHLFYITSRTYNPDDEGRHPFNSKVVDHDWGDEAELIVSDKDRLSFVPKNKRVG